jgi:hypothetical protein
MHIFVGTGGRVEGRLYITILDVSHVSIESLVSDVSNVPVAF